MTSETNRAIWRLGGLSAIAGALLAGVGNLAHPVTPRDDPEGVAHVIAHRTDWTLIHMVIFAGVVLLLIGMLALQSTFPEDGMPRVFATLAAYLATMGAALGVITVGLDGIAAKELADRWAAADSFGAGSLLLESVTLNETMNFAFAALFNMTFAGLPLIFFGLAITTSHLYPRALGWVALSAGVMSVCAGVFQAVTGHPTMTSLILTIIGPTVVTAWLFAIGLLLLRRSRQYTGSRSANAISQ